MPKGTAFASHLRAAALLAGLAALVILLSGPAVAAEATAARARITLQECVKCHYDIVRIVQRHGDAHRDKVSCTDCHRGHPPADTDVIPKCSRCHLGRSHFTLAGCLDCHQAHQPLRIRLPHRITKPCLTCHTEQDAQLRQFPSVHSELGCTACHNVHGRIPSCRQCHGGHSQAPAMADCGKCHHAHRPLAVEYGNDTPAEVCGACHDTVLAQLRGSNAKHRTFSCAFCHRQRHRTIPRCRDCHQEPHWPALHQRFPACGTCHGIAHDLVI